MGKHWQPRKQTVELQPGARPSRIRREPVPAASARKTLVLPVIPETWSGVTGITIFAVAIAIVTIGAGAILWPKSAPAQVERLGACDDAGGANCVIDGGTIRWAGVRTPIAGLVAPRIETPGCPEEQRQGHAAAERLIQLLNAGKVTVGPEVRGADGVARSKVMVDGRDVAPALIADGLAHKAGSDPADWCSES